MLDRRDPFLLAVMAALLTLTLATVAAYVVLELRAPGGVAAAAAARIGAIVVPVLGVLGGILANQRQGDAIHAAVNGANAAALDSASRSGLAQGAAIERRAVTNQGSDAAVVAAGDKIQEDRAKVVAEAMVPKP